MNTRKPFVVPALAQYCSNEIGCPIVYSIQLVADYSCSPRNDLFQEASKAMRSKPTKEEVVESSLVIVDSLWGFDRDKIRELHKTLQQKRNLFSPNRT